MSAGPLATGTFRESLDTGKAGERAIARYFRGKGYSVLPMYEADIESGKGPQLFLPAGALVAPDLLVFKPVPGSGPRVLWVEAKRKTGVTWHRITERWTVGLDRRHYRDYLEVQRNTPTWTVWVLFLSEGGATKDGPRESPAGLFGQRLSVLERKVHSETETFGKGGMVFWALDTLMRFGDYERTEMQNGQ